MGDSRIHEFRKQWQEKPVLQRIYADYYRRIAAACQPGRSLEIGSGPGGYRDFATDVICTDIQPAPWLDVAADAQAMPFASASFDNIVMLDVLHHIERPVRFLREASRVLRTGGRLVCLEPAITPVSWLFYACFHPEPVVMNYDPLAEAAPGSSRDPYDANQAIPTLLFGRYRSQLEKTFPELRLRSVERLSFFVYPLSGGFRPWCLVPLKMVDPLLRWEARMAPVLRSFIAFRLLAVMEKL